MTNEAQSRLGALLWRDYDRLRHNALALAGYVKKTGGPVERRKLLRIMHGDDVKLTFADVAALRAYLMTVHRVHFEALFESQGVLAALVAGGRVKVLLGSEPRGDRTDLSRWDILAMHELFTRVNPVSGSVRLEFEDGLFEPPASGAGPAAWRAVAARQAWHAALGPAGPGVVAVGSPRACLATECVLAEMFGFEAFARPEPGAARPFAFVWHPDERARHPSAFSGDPAALGGRDKKLAAAVQSGKAWAFRLGDAYHRLDRYSPRATTYGVLAAQRRRAASGADATTTWVAVAGLSGPATAAAAQFVADPEFALPPAPPGGNSAVVWMAVAADVREQPDLPGDNRQVAAVRRLAGPFTWPPPA